MYLTKHHGLGNDFLIAVDPYRDLTAEDAIAWCDRRRGFGADGLIQAKSGDGGTDSSQWQMTLFNSDGSQAEVSGNGLRCLGQALAHSSPQLASFEVATDGGVRQLVIESLGEEVTSQVMVDMGPAREGPPSYEHWSELGVEALNQQGVDLGNPHLVVEVESPQSVDLAVVGAKVESAYSEGLNVHFISAISRETLELRVWERGAGITQACGSGACAAGWVAQGWGLVNNPVEVVMPGGSARVEARAAGDGSTLRLTGPAAYVGDVIVNG